MSYAAKGEKVFSSQQEAGRNDPGAAPKRSDHRLKRFTSTLDKRAWHFCEEVRSSHFHDLMSGSQTSLSPDPCHRYVPLEDLIRILMAEKDELIRELQERLKNAENSAEKQTMQEQIAELTRELNKTRDMLRKAMHKLQNIDEIVNENKTLHCRLRCSEERVQYLEERKKRLECELADLRSRSQIQMDLEKAQQMLQVVNRERELSPKTDEAYLQCLASERDQLQEKVKNLEKELEESRKKEAEIEMLKKQSHSDSLDREEMSRENECYKKKLASMKCLEKQIQELKKQGRSLADKYKREAQKAAEQMNKMCQASKELQGLREERDSLRKRVNELSSYECQYNKLVRKLQRVDAVIAENENLNCKVLALENLEKENDYLRCRLEAIQEVEVNAAEDKERIMQLQCAVADQEEEMKDLLCQIERLTSGRHEEELERLKCELYEKNSKLKLCEEQLAEIPMLEAEIDELRMKLQCCCKEFPEKKRGESGYQRVEVRFPATSTGIRAKYKSPGERCSSVIGIRREEKVEFEDKHASCQEILQSDSGRAYKVTSEFSQKKDMMSCEEVHNLLQSSKGIISCVLEDMIEHQKEMEELEICNRSMKEEIEMLKSKVGSSDKDSLLEEINRLKRALEEKEVEISRLQSSANVRDGEDVETIKELNRQMKAELEAACVGLKQVANLEKLLEKEREARCQAESRLLGEGGAGPIGSAGAAIATRATVAIRGTEATGATVAIRGTEATGGTVATRGTEATGATVATRGTEATGATGATRGTEATRATVAIRGTEATGATVATRGTEATGATVATRGTEATGATGATRGTEATGATVATRGTEATEATGTTGATGVVREAVKTEKGVEDDSDLDWCKTLQKETDDLKLQIEALNKLTGELKKENELLRELQQPCPDFSKELDEKCALENLLSLLQAELDAFKGQKLSDECEALRKELKRVMEQNCQLKALVDCYRQRLDLEKKSNELNQKRLGPQSDESPPKRSLPADGGGVEETPKGERGREPTALTPSEILARERAEGRKTDKSERESDGKHVADRKSEEERERERLEKEKLEREKLEGKKSGEKEGEKERLEREKAKEEAKKAEAKTLEEEAKKAETKRLEEEATKAEPKRLEEEVKKAEPKRLEEEKPPKEGKTEEAGKAAEAKGGKEKDNGCEEELKALRENMVQLKKENQNLQSALTDAEKKLSAAGKPDAVDKDLQKELEQLRKEKNDMAQQLAERPPATGAPPDYEKELERLKNEKENLAKLLAEKSAAGTQATAPSGLEDCLKELEKLKNEKENLAKQLAEKSAAATQATAPSGQADLLKELEKLKNEKENLAKQLAEKSAAATQATAPSGQADLLKELEKLKNEKENLAKQLAEKSAAGTQATAPSGLEDCLKELEKLKKEKENLAKQLAEKSAAATQATAPSGQADLLKELEKLKNEKENLAKQLAEKSAAGTQATAPSGLEDCLKELEKLKNEKDNLAKQLAEKSAAAAQAADYLRELENLKNERKEWEKKLADAKEKAAKEKADLQKELDQTKKEKGEMTQQPGAARAGGPADLQQAEADCAEKIKKLMEQHEKELANRDRLCNENLNAMKAGYEGDIRKLVDRHKQSIMRLQGLHEDEVQEMNLNYETQLETMQTQSQAAINDIAKGSAAKARKLEEQHAEDMKSMQGKYKNALEAKDAEYKDQIGGLRSSLTKSQQELEALRRQGNLTDAEKMKAQQARELQKARRTSKQKLGAMKSKMEKEMRKSQEEIDALRQKLKEQAGSVCQCKYSRKPAKIRDPTCPLDFNEVLEKILEEGLDSLTFNEVALVHRKTCCALEGIVMRSNAGPVLELEPPVSDWCPHTPLLEADKQQLLSRIFDLENAILEKQRQTQDAIISMEVAIKKERCRLQEVRKTLQCEQQKNSELQQLLSSQTKLQTDLRRERDQLGNQASMHQSLCREKSKQLDEEMKSKKCLEAEVEKLKNTLKQLCVSLDPERRVTDPKQGGPTELMRLKLEQSVREERRLALQLENEVKCRMQLQCQLQTLRQSLKHMVNLPAVETAKRCSQNPLDAKKVKERQNLDQINEKTNAIKTKFSKKQKK